MRVAFLPDSLSTVPLVRISCKSDRNLLDCTVCIMYLVFLHTEQCAGSPKLTFNFKNFSRDRSGDGLESGLSGQPVGDEFYGIIRYYSTEPIGMGPIQAS
jgi:hypothetical protein